MHRGILSLCRTKSSWAQGLEGLSLTHRASSTSDQNQDHEPRGLKADKGLEG